MFGRHRIEYGTSRFMQQDECKEFRNFRRESPTENLKTINFLKLERSFSWKFPVAKLIGREMSGKNFAMLGRPHWAVLCSPAQQTGKYTGKWCIAHNFWGRCGWFGIFFLGRCVYMKIIFSWTPESNFFFRKWSCAWFFGKVCLQDIVFHNHLLPSKVEWPTP